MKNKLLTKIVPVVIAGGIKYLLRDDFTDTRAAGAVNGTLATPGPGTRAVKDTNTKISVGSDYLNYATGAAMNDGYWLDAVVRTPGRVLLFLVNSTSGNMLAIGYGNASLSDSTGCEMRIYGNQLYHFTAGAVSVGAYTNSTNYYLACVILSTGEYWFVKGGTQYTTWTFICVERLRTTDPVYPMIVTQSTTAVCKAGFLRVPSKVFLPTLLLYDAFTRSNGAIGNSIATGPDGQSVAQRTWSGATWTIATNAAINTPNLGAEEATGNLVVGTWYKITASEGDYFYVGSAIGDTFRAAAATALDASNKVQAFTTSELFCTFDSSIEDTAIEVKLGALTAKTQAGIVFALDSEVTPQAFAILYWDGSGRVRLDTVAAGVYTSRRNIEKAFTAGDALLLTDGVYPKDKILHKDAAGTLTSISTLTGVPTGTIQGLFSTDAGNTFNIAAIFPIGTEDQYADLDRFLE